MRKEIIALLFFVLPAACLGQSAENAVLPSFYLSAGVSGFIPVAEAYRINYSTKTLALPIELHGALSFPLNADASFPIIVRANRRKANFLDNTSITTIAIDPGIRYYLEAQRPDDLRFFIAGGAALARSEAKSEIEPSESGETSGQQSVTERYYNYGLFAELGLGYPVSKRGTLDAIVHIAAYLGDPVAQGGLGNVGGISIGAEYRHAF